MQMCNTRLWVVPGMLVALFAPAVPCAGTAPQADRLKWDKPTLERKRTVRKKRHVEMVTEKVPLLRIEWVVLKRDENELPRETPTDAIFRDGDRLQLKIKANQEGYLHIFQNTGGEENGEQVFPDSSVRHGNNLVNAYEMIVIPSDCERKLRDENGNCWFRVNDPPGSEIFTVILSREAMPDALKEIRVVGGKIKLRDLDRIKETPTTMTSREVFSSEKGANGAPHTITVINKDRSNNEELIVRITLNHKERSTER